MNKYKRSCSLEPYAFFAFTYRIPNQQRRRTTFNMPFSHHGLFCVQKETFEIYEQLMRWTFKNFVEEEIVLRSSLTFSDYLLQVSLVRRPWLLLNRSQIPGSTLLTV